MNVWRSAYLWVRTVILHERMLNLNALLGIPRSDSSVDIIQFINRQVGIQLVEFLELLQRLEVVDTGRLGLRLNRTRDRRDLLSLASLPKEVRPHVGGVQHRGGCRSLVGKTTSKSIV